MAKRFAIYTVFGILIALLLICAASLIRLVETGLDSRYLGNWLLVQQNTPLLWLADVAAFCIVLLMFRAGAEVARSQQQTRAHAELAAEQLRRQEEYHRQVEALIARNEQLEKEITALEEARREREAMIASLEREIEVEQRNFEAEARRLTEQAFRAMHGQVEANARQLDAMNMALQYHRAELTQLRHSVRALQMTSEPAQIARLTPAEMTAILDDSQRPPEGPMSEGPALAAASTSVTPPSVSAADADSAAPEAGRAEAAPGDPEPANPAPEVRMEDFALQPSASASAEAPGPDSSPKSQPQEAADGQAASREQSAPNPPLKDWRITI